MRRAVGQALAALALLCLLVIPALAGELEESVGLSGLTGAAQEYLDGYLDLDDIDEGDFAAGVEAILDTGTGQLPSILKRAGRSGVLLLAVAVLCGLTGSVEGVLGSGTGNLDPARLAGAAAVAAIAAADVNSLMGLGREALGQMDAFSKVLLPVVTAACAAAGAPLAAAARQGATLLFLSALLTAANTFAVPLVYAYVAAVTANAAVGNGGLERMAALLKRLVTALLSALVTVFVLYLSISGSVSGSADALAQKAAKTAISGMVPVVGKILSDAAETVVAGAGILRGTVGVVGMLAVLGICLTPFLSLACHYLVYKCAAALAHTVSPGPMASLIDAIGSAFALELGVAGTGAAILYIALITSIQVVTV